MYSFAVGNAARLLVLLIVVATSSSWAKVPDWLRGLSRSPLPAYSTESDAVVLLDEVRTKVSKSGKVESFHRRAYKVLTISGTEVSWVALPFNEEMKISDLKAWNLKADGFEHEVGKKEAIETQLGDQSFYSDTSSLLLQIPRVEVGSVVGYEYKSSRELKFLQQRWQPQGRMPVVRARFRLELPKNWTFDRVTANCPELKVQKLGEKEWLWQLDNLKAIPAEEGMPPLSNLAAKVFVAFRPPTGKVVQAKAFADWDDLGTWTEGLMDPQVAPSSELIEQARNLNTLRTLSDFVRNDIRYVAIEIGMGGYRPHSANGTFQRRFGDCKDKVTLLKSMLSATEREAYPVLISAQREKIIEEFPSPLFFDHMIAAVPLKEEGIVGPAVLNHPELGKLLFLDVTDRRTPFGELPSSLQGVKAMLVRNGTSFLVETPVAAPPYNRILRKGQFQVLSNGILKGKVHEMYRGMQARLERATFLEMPRDHWIPILERFLGRYLPGIAIGEARAGEIEETGMLSEAYSFAAPYAYQKHGNLLLLRPCILGSKFREWSLKKDRKYPFQFGFLRVTSDIFEFVLPEGAVVEALPEPLELDLPFATYTSSISQDGEILKYLRKMEIKKLEIAARDVLQLHNFYQEVNRDECNMVLLRLPTEDPGASSNSGH